MRFTVSRKRRTALSSCFDAIHTYRVESPEGARTLTVTRGSDFETMLRQAGRSAEQPELPPQMEPTPEIIAVLVQLCAKNGIDIVGPPLA